MRITSKLPLFLLLFGFCFSQTGCFDSPDYEADLETGETFLEQFRNRGATNSYTHLDMAWVAKEPVPLHLTQRLPEEHNVTISIRSGKALPLREIASFLYKISHVPIRLTPDAEAKLLGLYTLNTGGSGNSSRSNNTSQNKNGDEPEPKEGFDVRVRQTSYSGPLLDYLDLLSSELGLSWKFENQQILLYFLGCRSFSIHAIPTSTQISTTVNTSATADVSSSSQSGASAQSSGGQSAQSTAISISTDILTDISANLETLLTPGIGRYSLSTSTGTINVIDTEESLDRIAAYIEKENRAITKQVLLNIKILSISLTRSDATTVDWTAAFQEAASAAGGEVSPSCTLGNNGALGDEATESLMEAKITPSLSFDGKTYSIPIGLLINALQKQGEVALISSPSVTTLNLQPVPVQVANQKNYVAKETSTLISTSDDSEPQLQTTLEAGTVTSGLSMNLLPFVMEDNVMLLQYSLNLSELVAIESVSSAADQTNSAGSSKLQLPELRNKIFSQKVKLRSGQTLILTGFEQHNSKSSSSAPFSLIKYLKGTSTLDDERQVILMLITPIILE